MIKEAIKHATEIAKLNLFSKAKRHEQEKTIRYILKDPEKSLPILFKEGENNYIIGYTPKGEKCGVTMYLDDLFTYNNYNKDAFVDILKRCDLMMYVCTACGSVHEDENEITSIHGCNKCLKE